MSRGPYLATDLDPEAYYRERAKTYSNPHASAVCKILSEFVEDLKGTVLDLGCGDGLATNFLATKDEHGQITNGPFIGVDREPRMVDRYRKETGCAAHIRTFWDELPPADVAVAAYSLHLCPISLLPQMGSRLVCAGIQKLVVVSPLKRPSTILGYSLVRDIKRNVGPNGKTVYGKLFQAL